MAGRVIVTGAAGALGRSVVQRFLAEAQPVLAVDVDEAALAELTPLATSNALAVRRVDLTDGAAVNRMFNEVEGASGAPSAVVHLVGAFRFGAVRDFSDAGWSFLLRVNLETTFQVFRESMRRFERQRGGVLLAVSSPAALHAEAGMGPYGATKAAVLRLVEASARELAPAGVRVNAVVPGTMDTPANRAAMPEVDPATWVSTDDVASVIHYLTTPAAAAISGAAVEIPGPTL